VRVFDSWMVCSTRGRQDAKGAVEGPATRHRVDVGARHDGGAAVAEPAEGVAGLVHPGAEPGLLIRSRSHARASSWAGLQQERVMPLPSGFRPKRPGFPGAPAGGQ